MPKGINSRLARSYREEHALRQDGLCIYCACVLTWDYPHGQPGPTDCTLEHLIPRSKGGSNRFTNFAASCKSCNTARSSTAHEVFLLLARSA